MSIRPGSEHIGGVNGNLPTKMIPFVAAFDDTAIVELTDNTARFWVNDFVALTTTLVTRAAVATTVPAFSSPSWVTASDGSITISSTAGGLVIANLNQGSVATATCAVSVAGGDQATEHAVRLVVTDGPIIFRIGSTSGADDIFESEVLDTGTYSMAFTPGTGTIYIQFVSMIGPENFNTLLISQPQGLQTVTVASIAIEGAGVMSLPTPWPTSVIYPLPSTIRSTPSADIIFIAAPGVPQYQINRYSPTSWSIVLYKPVKGPMNATPGNSSVILTPNTTSGNGQLFSNQPQFSPGDVGSLFRLFHNTQIISQNISFANTYTDAIEVTGVSTTSLIIGGNVVDIPCTDRQFQIQINQTWTGTITLMRSFTGPNVGFTAYQTYTSNQALTVIDDGLNNEIVWYRFGFLPGGYGTGLANCSLIYAGGGGPGVCHVTGFVSSTEVEIEILVTFAASTGAADWHQSEWTGSQGYPTSTAIHEGRLWWAGADRLWGSTSDDYSNFDFDAIGDASYIDVSIGQGPIANVNWLLSLDNLLAGTDTSITTARSDAIQDPLTPTNFNLRFSTTTGSTGVQAVKIDNQAIYIDQSTRKLYLATYDLYSYNYKVTELTNLNHDIGFLGFAGMAVQRNPDTRLFFIRNDGQMVSLLYDVQDQVNAFWRAQTNGIYEDVIVLPGVIEDMVFVVVNRFGGTRFIEKFARLDECQGQALSKIADCHLAYTGAATTTFSAPWLANQEVVCWADGIDVSPVQLDNSGEGTIAVAAENICAGLGYSAQFLTAKLAYAAQGGTAINQKKRVDHIGFVLQNTHCQGIQYGSYILPPFVGAGNQPTSADSGLWDENAPLDNLPLTELGHAVPANAVWAYYEQIMIEFPSEDAGTDSRIQVVGNAPRPATVLGFTIAIETAN